MIKALLALATAATLFGAGSAHAGNVSWSVSIDGPHAGAVIGGGGHGYHGPAPVYVPVPVYAPAPVYAPVPVYALRRSHAPVPVYYEPELIYEAPPVAYRSHPDRYYAPQRVQSRPVPHFRHQQRHHRHHHRDWIASRPPHWAGHHGRD